MNSTFLSSEQATKYLRMLNVDNPLNVVSTTDLAEAERNRYKMPKGKQLVRFMSERGLIFAFARDEDIEKVVGNTKVN